MSWRVFATDASQPDFEKLTEIERAALDTVLFGWVEHGPPRLTRRVAAGVELFADEVQPGLVVTYMVNENLPYVAIVRVRRT